MKIVISEERITHYQALCGNCGWVEADNIDREWLRQQVRKHIRKTGHSVSIEKGTSTLYAAQLRAVDATPVFTFKRRNNANKIRQCSPMQKT